MRGVIESLPRQAGSNDAGLDVQIDALKVIVPHNRFAFRAVRSLRKGRWLFDVGAFKAGPRVFPWLNVAVQLGGAQ